MIVIVAVLSFFLGLIVRPTQEDFDDEQPTTELQ